MVYVRVGGMRVGTVSFSWNRQEATTVRVGAGAAMEPEMQLREWGPNRSLRPTRPTPSPGTTGTRRPVHRHADPNPNQEQR